MSSRRTGIFDLLAGKALVTVAVLLVALPGWAQYPGQVAKSGKASPELRSIAVLEWTGEAGKPKASRLVPVLVLDGDQLQDGGIYLARPEPMALDSEVEYELQQNGKAVGLFDIRHAGLEQGSWVGYGAWKPMPVVKPKAPAWEPGKIKIEDEESGRPVLHRKHHAGDAPGKGTGDSGSSGNSGQAPASDPDRPTLHRASGSTDDASTSPATDSDRPVLHKKDSSESTSNTSASSAPDPDRPTLHKKEAGSEAESSAATDDPDRPKLKKGKKTAAEDIGHVDSLPGVTDPDRPVLKRGKSSGNGPSLIPTLMGMPPDMQQAVAVSDAKMRTEHPWSYSWANPEDEGKMKSALEGMARDALGLTPPSAPVPAPKRTTARKKAKQVPPSPAPVPLADEQFRVFELAYGSGATLVLTAHTEGTAAEQKFVTLVAQPDLYGNVRVLLKSVTDGAHLDETPRMRLVDAVDALADNRGELLFELRGAAQRQFALYRVLRGRADKLFVSGGSEFGTESRN
jgi:hypothetical protein